MNENQIASTEPVTPTAASEQIDFTKEDSFLRYITEIRKKWAALSDKERTELWSATKIFLRNHIEERIAKFDNLDLLLKQVSNLGNDTIFDGSEIQDFKTQIDIQKQKQNPNA